MSRRASGLKAWLIQRLSAVYLGLFGVYLLLFFAFAPPQDHAQLVAWASSPWVALGLLVFIPLLLAHAWVGIRDVLIDYLKPIGLRVGLLSLMALMFLASGLWALQALILVQI
ncbi:MAG: succinate dehydrogenase, hydrophobic membrane anchor protein [Halochromatium sp.]|nr:succinate dehydrogenase, hydrophobic membrane anchor protein [Halochromatium sp.]